MSNNHKPKRSTLTAWQLHCCQAAFCLYSALAAPRRGLSQDQHYADSDLPEVQFSAFVDDQHVEQLHGSMTIRNWASTEGYCLYLPFADVDYGEDRGTSRRFEMLSGKAGRLVFQGGKMSVSLPAELAGQAGLIQSSDALPQIIRLEVASNWFIDHELILNFRSEVPRLAKSDGEQWAYDGFMPQLLAKCPAAHLDPEYYRQAMPAHYSGHILTPSTWVYAGPGTVVPSTVQGATDTALNLKSRPPAFVMGHDFKRAVNTIAGTEVEFLYHSEHFLDIADTVQEVLPFMIHILGPLPFPKLTVIETKELQRQGLPGLIALNTPAQALFSVVQRSLLNWQHWVFAMQLAHQWFGAAINVHSPDDEWLLSGLSEFATLEALSRHPAHFNLFNLSARFRFLSFDYLQVSEILAALLRRNAPFGVLTSQDLVTKDPAPTQPPLLSMKHAFALRQLKSYAGEELFFRYLHHFTQAHLAKLISPKDFAAYLQHLPSPFNPTLRRELEGFLRHWWTVVGWPDFALKTVVSEQLPDGRTLTKLEAKQQGAIDYPPLLGVQDASKNWYLARGTKEENTPDAPWTASVVSPSPPSDARVDPTHESFDADRFNNRLGAPELNFFPGSAETLRDDAYTILWLPYAFKRPGEPFSLGLSAALFRYINSGLLLRIETAPGTHLAAIDLSDNFQIPDYALSGGVDLSQNYDHDRLAQVSLSRWPLFDTNPALGLEFYLRHRERAGEPQSDHSTFAEGIRFAPIGVRRLCSYGLYAQYEKAPGAFARGFNYDRRYGTAQGDCNITNRSSVSLRIFRGKTTGQGELPQVSSFKPVDLKEAHLRLVQGGLPWSNDIITSNLDAYMPFFIPFPNNSMILSRQMRWRMFYDLGRTYDQATIYRSSGAGVMIPFGGDLAGAGSLAVTRLTVLGVFYTDINGRVSRAPGFLLDLTGDL